MLFAATKRTATPSPVGGHYGGQRTRVSPTQNRIQVKADACLEGVDRPVPHAYGILRLLAFGCNGTKGEGCQIHDPDFCVATGEVELMFKKLRVSAAIVPSHSTRCIPVSFWQETSLRRATAI